MADEADLEFEAIYDDATAARLQRSGPRRSAIHRPSRPTGWRRGAVTGTLLTGLALGLQEVFDPPPDEVVLEEVDLDGLPHTGEAVSVVLVEGAPRASRVILRPWLVRA